MYENKSKHFIFELSNKRLIKIFYQENSGIYASMINRRGFWSEPALVVKDARSDFYADMDKDENISIIFRNNEGKLLKGTFTDGNWRFNGVSEETTEKSQKCQPKESYNTNFSKAIMPLERSIEEIRETLKDLLNKMDYIVKINRSYEPAYKHSIDSVLEKEITVPENRSNKEEQNYAPVMPGTGFSSVTADYLKNLRNK